MSMQGRDGAVEHATNGIAIDGFCRALEPIERREGVVILGARIGTVLEQDRDRFHETCLGRVVEGGRAPAVAPLRRRNK